MQWAVQVAQQNQLPSGAFSISYFRRSVNSRNLDEHLAATGHTLEFLALTLPVERLKQQWVQRAVYYMCDLLERTRRYDLECGALYHAAHGLALYRERVWGTREAEGKRSAAHTSDFDSPSPTATLIEGASGKDESVRSEEINSPG